MKNSGFNKIPFVTDMPNYDFLILQYNEFEHLTRDLLQKKEKIFVESFTPGKDGGVDLRFAKVREENTIVQAKRVKDYTSLKRTLLKEVSKVKTLNPERYIISTSVGLTPENKTEIQTLFNPYIQSTEDILGRDDLNNLLGQNPDVEKQYYKLWIGSTAVLEDILNKRINNWSAIELETIRREVSTYVMNKSFNDALEILTKNRYVIISGIPGIGKTTLARMLVNYLLSEGYEEFVKLTGIGDAAQKLQKGKKQVFFFDDFLGSTFFQNDEKGFDQKLVAFIEKVKYETDKIFILSTREYILAEAKQTYDVFSTKNLELAKCVLDLSNYTESIRAEILYNHLAMARLPLPYVRALIAKRSYLRIIQHHNFNPRIIETFLNSELYLRVEPDQFVAKFIDFFDRPYAVWELAFRQIKPIAQYALLVRMSMGDKPVLLSDWYLATKKFVQGTEKELHLTINKQVWNDALKIIEGTFVFTKFQKDEHLACYQSPSVFDFLQEWIKNLSDIQEYIIRESYFAEQIYKAFSDTGYPSFFDYGRVKINESAKPALAQAFKRLASELHFCSLKDYGTTHEKVPQDITDFLLGFERSFGGIYKRKPDLLRDIASQNLLEDTRIPLFKRMDYLDKLGEGSKQELDLEQLASVVLEQSEHLDDFVNSMDLLLETEAGSLALKSNDLLKKVEEAIEWEIEEADSEQECNHISDSLSALVEHIPSLNEAAWQGAIDEVISRFPREEDYDEDFSRDLSSATNDKNQYEEMFTSLLESSGDL